MPSYPRVRVINTMFNIVLRLGHVLVSRLSHKCSASLKLIRNLYMIHMGFYRVIGDLPDAH